MQSEQLLHPYNKKSWIALFFDLWIEKTTTQMNDEATLLRPEEYS